MEKIEYDIRDDIKQIIAFKDRNGALRDPSTTPFEISFFSLKRSALGEVVKDKNREWKAWYDGKEYVNCKVVVYDGVAKPEWVGQPVVLVMYDYDKHKYGDKGFFSVGKLQQTTYLSYPDSDMQDDFYNKMYNVQLIDSEEEKEIYIVNRDLI